MSIEIQNISHQYKGGRILFQGLSLQLSGNDVTALVGPSGCGKSTLLRLLAGLEGCASGSVELKGVGALGFVFQEPRLLPWRSVQENLVLGAELRGQTISPQIIQEGLTLVRLNDNCLKLFPHQLSGGMKMRVSLLRALVLQPDLLLMDEPLAALDESTRQLLQEEVARIFELKKCQVILVTHSLSEAVFLADRILVLGRDGELIQQVEVSLPHPRLESLRSKMQFIEIVTGLQRQFRDLLVRENEGLQ